MVTITDLQAAERHLREAQEELEEFRRNPDRWSAFESMTRDGRKELNFLPTHFDKLEILSNQVERAAAQLHATRTAFMTEAP